MLWNIFCALVRPGTRENHRQQGKCGCFLPIRICRIQWLCSLFLFRPQIPFLGKFGPKNQNCQFILKCGTWVHVLNGWPQTNVMEHFLCIGLAKYTRTSPPPRLLFSSNLNMQNSEVMFTFSNFDRKCHFWANLIQKIKIVSLF